MAQIQDLPVELLGLIFKRVFLASRALRDPELYESDSESEEEEGGNTFTSTIRKLERNEKLAKRVFPPEMIWTDEQVCSRQNSLSTSLTLANCGAT